MTCPRCAALVAAIGQIARDLDHEGYTLRGMHSPEASLVLDALEDWRAAGVVVDDTGGEVKPLTIIDEIRTEVPNA